MSLISFTAADYGPQVAELLASERLPELGPGEPVAEVADRLNQLSAPQLAQYPAIGNLERAKCCLAGLWLWFDYLEESHSISQSIDSPTGSFWHGIMHRREPDYSNAKHWFRRTGAHPIFPQLLEYVNSLPSDEVVDQLASDAWDPFLFVDLCQRQYQSGSELERTCREIARAEWQLLFDFRSEA